MIFCLIHRGTQSCKTSTGWVWHGTIMTSSQRQKNGVYGSPNELVTGNPKYMVVSVQITDGRRTFKVDEETEYVTRLQVKTSEVRVKRSRNILAAKPSESYQPPAWILIAFVSYKYTFKANSCNRPDRWPNETIRNRKPRLLLEIFLSHRNCMRLAELRKRCRPLTTATFCWLMTRVSATTDVRSAAICGGNAKESSSRRLCVLCTFYLRIKRCRAFRMAELIICVLTWKRSCLPSAAFRRYRR